MNYILIINTIFAIIGIIFIFNGLYKLWGYIMKCSKGVSKKEFESYKKKDKKEDKQMIRRAIKKTGKK